MFELVRFINVAIDGPLFNGNRQAVFRFAVKTPSLPSLYQHFRSAWPPGPFLAPFLLNR